MQCPVEDPPVLSSHDKASGIKRWGVRHLKGQTRIAMVLSNSKAHPLALPTGALKCAEIFCPLRAAQVYGLGDPAQARSL